jgi:hypothetical protein
MRGPALLLALALTGAAPAGAQGPTDAAALRAQLQREYAEAFRNAGLLPILLPRGHAPGDVIASSGEMLSRGRECFDGLRPDEAPSRVDAIDLSWNAAARLALGVDAAGTATARGNAEDRVQLRFEGARALLVSRRGLHDSLRAGACPEVEHALKAATPPAGTPWLLIGEVILAKPVARVSRSRTGGANLSFLQRLGVTVLRLEGGADLARAQVAEVTVTEAVPVAFRPAVVVVTPEISERFGGRGVRLAEFDPAVPAHRAVLDAWLAAHLQALAVAAR